MDWVIAIPSYKREFILQNKTLATLETYQIPKEKIFIFVADQEQFNIYTTALDPHYYNKIIIAEKGLHNARNFINSYFPIGQYIVEADDDIKGFFEYDPKIKRKEKRLEDLKGLIERGFTEAVKHNARLWGLYPSANGMFMNEKVNTDLRLIVGSFWGQINPGPEITLDFSEKEDYLRTLLFFNKDKAVVRLNFASPRTCYYTTPGGMVCNPKRKEDQEEAVKILLERFPHAVKLNRRRKTGFPEIRLYKSYKADDFATT